MNTFSTTAQTLFHVTHKSGNKKTGPIPVATTSENSCPESCPLYGGGCYAKAGPLALHWRKVSDPDGMRGVSGDAFLRAIESLPEGQLWRHNQAGDLPHYQEYIDGGFLSDLVAANTGKRGFTYTHHDPGKPHNLVAIKAANNNGFTVNLSGNNIPHAVSLYKRHRLPTVTVLASDAPNKQTVQGVDIVACPAEKSDRITCANCGLCQHKDRNYIIGFRAHGTKKKKADIIARGV